MSSILRFFIRLIIVAGGVHTATSPALAVPTLPANSGFSALAIEPRALHAGERRERHVRLKHAANQLTILTRNITYRSGLTQNVVPSTVGNPAMLAWSVPSKPGTGRATYQLTTGGCGCSDRNNPQPDATENRVQGSLTIE